MAKYKYLTPNKMGKQKSCKKFAKFKKILVKGGFFGLFVVVVSIVFIVGAVAFYVTIDRRFPENAIESPDTTSSGTADEDKSLDTHFEKELENSLDSKVCKDEETEQTQDTGTSEEGDNKGEISEPKSDSGKEKHDENKKAFRDTTDTKDTKMCDFSAWNKTCKPELMVVNSENPIPEGHKVVTKACRNKEVNVIMADKLETMIRDAQKDGAILWISSGYRDVKYQTRLFDNQVQKEIAQGFSIQDAIARTKRVLAEPGKSEHNLGLAVDLNGVDDNFFTTKEYKWLTENADKYGFIERYQKKWYAKTGVSYEPWHFRYVGDCAGDIKQSGLCLEDYVQKYLM